MLVENDGTPTHPPKRGFLKKAHPTLPCPARRKSRVLSGEGNGILWPISLFQASRPHHVPAPIARPLSPGSTCREPPSTWPGTGRVAVSSCTLGEWSLRNTSRRVCSWWKLSQGHLTGSERQRPARGRSGGEWRARICRRGRCWRRSAWGSTARGGGCSGRWRSGGEGAGHCSGEMRDSIGWRPVGVTYELIMNI